MITVARQTRIRGSVLVLAAIAVFLFVPRIAQDQGYHSFADSRSIFGIPNFWNVVSHLAFAVVGIAGLQESKSAVGRVLFGGVLLTFFGSAYYYLAPGDERLVWDRLPMTLVFMAFLCWLLDDERLLWLLVAVGIASIVWWCITGDLRLYGVVQFVPLLVLIPALFTAPHREALWAAAVFYVLAKLAEHFDSQIFALLPLSGHTLKHFLAAASAYSILRWRRADASLESTRFEGRKV